MILYPAIIIGALLGWRRAAALKGNIKDKLQYALAFAMIFAVIGLFASVLIDRNF